MSNIYQVKSWGLATNWCEYHRKQISELMVVKCHLRYSKLYFQSYQ